MKIVKPICFLDFESTGIDVNKDKTHMFPGFRKHRNRRKQRQNSSDSPY